MNRRFISLRICLVCTVAMCLWLAWTHWETVRPTPINVHAAIDTGMSEEEVIALIGGPSGDYSGDTVALYWTLGSTDGSTRDEVYFKEWVSREGVVVVEFGRDGKVICITWGSVVARSTWLDRIVDVVRSCLS